MKMNLEKLARIVEESAPNVKTVCFPEENQIVVSFADRPDVEVSLLTPWMQKKLKNNELDSDELFLILTEINSINNYRGSGH